MKTKPDFLWKLVHAMTTDELFLFRQSTASIRQKNKPVYELLFDSIQKQKKSYNEERLINELSPLITKKNIGLQKIYLKEKIFTILTAAADKDNEKAGLISKLTLVSALRKKNMINEALELLEEVYAAAVSGEHYEVLSIAQSEIQRNAGYGYQPMMVNEFESTFLLNTRQTLKLLEIPLLIHHYNSLTVVFKKNYYQNEQEYPGQLRQISESLIGSGFTEDAPFLHTHLKVMIYGMHLYMLNIDGSYPLFRQVFHKWTNNPDMIRRYTGYYLEFILLFYYECVRIKKIEDIPQIFTDPANKLIHRRELRMQFESIAFLAMNRYYNISSQYTQVEEILERFKFEADLWSVYISQDLKKLLYGSGGISFILFDKFKEAHKYLYNALYTEDSGTYKEVNSSFHLLLLLVTHEMQNELLFRSEYQRAYKYLRKQHGRSRPFENILLSYFNKSFSLIKKGNSTVALSSLTLQKLDEGQTDEFQEKVFRTFNFPLWIRCKMLNIPYRNRELSRTYSAS